MDKSISNFKTLKLSGFEFVQELISKAENLRYKENQENELLEESKMVISVLLGDTTHYLHSLRSISFTPVVFRGMGAIIDAKSAESSFNYGKEQLLTLLNTILKEVTIRSTINSDKSLNMNTIDSNKIFIVHGHNNEMKEAVARMVEKLKLKPIILHEQSSQGKTIIEKFETNSDVAFAIVLLSADDKGFNKNEIPEAAKLRSRQNVIFELGYFIGKIGRKRVLALYEDIANFELPSDYSGVIFIKYDNANAWKLELVKELKAIGIPVSADDLLS